MKEYTELDNEIGKTYAKLNVLESIKIVVDSQLTAEKNWLKHLILQKRAGMKTP